MKVLYIDLSKTTSTIRFREDLKSYLGGTGLATALFLEEVDLSKPPLSEEQPIVIAKGFLTPYFPVATKSVAIFYSPLTNSLGESHAGGRLALAMSLSGIDAIVIKGKSVKPNYLVINDGNVVFKDATHLKGIYATATATYIREKEKDAGLRSILRIGPAGENGAAFSMVVVDTYRHFGRLGLGASFGSKNLKAVLVSGTGKDYKQFSKESGYRNFFEELHAKATSQLMRKYHEFGTAVNVLPLNELGGLPTENLKKTSFKYAENISGESFAENVLTRKFACAGCPVGCIHIATIRRKFAAEEEWERVDVSYDYELIYSLGSLLGIKDCNGVLSLIEKVEELGIDAIYAGVMLAWLTEAYEKSIIGEEELDGLKPIFGNVEVYKALLEKLTYSEKSFFQTARLGLTALCERYGGHDFALLVNKNAMAGYHTGYANLLGQHLVGIRNAHTDNAGYSLDQENKEYSPEELIERLYEEEVFRAFFNCTGLCLFVRKIYDVDTLLKASKMLGVDIQGDKILEIGEKIYLKKLIFKIKCGFKIEEYVIPERFFETAAGRKMMSKDFVNKAKNYFAKKIKEKIGEGEI